jgi:hypothetical protein
MSESAERKADAAAACDQAVFEVTAFGRRRVSRVPKPLRFLGWLVSWPFAFIYRRFRPVERPN